MHVSSKTGVFEKTKKKKTNKKKTKQKKKKKKKKKVLSMYVKNIQYFVLFIF